jgi:hypothetical protein
VTANVVDVKTGTERTTNEFRFTWCRTGDGEKLDRTIVPKTYAGKELRVCSQCAEEKLTFDGRGYVMA